MRVPHVDTASRTVLCANDPRSICSQLMLGWVQAGLWGLLAGSALLLGAAIGFLVRVPPRLASAIMAFGSGVLISALSFELMDVAFRQGGIASTGAGFLGGAVVYTAA